MKRPPVGDFSVRSNTFPLRHDIPTFLKASIALKTTQVHNERGQPGHEAAYQLYYVVIFLSFGASHIPMTRIAGILEEFGLLRRLRRDSQIGHVHVQAAVIIEVQVCHPPPNPWVICATVVGDVGEVAIPVVP